MKKSMLLATALLAATAPFAVSAADLTGTVTLAANQTLNLETGATGSSGGDLLWTGSGVTFQANASGYNLGGGGAATYGFLDQTTIQSTSSIFTKTLPGATIVKDAILLAKTNSSHYSKMLVTAATGTSITLQFTTFGATGGSGGTPGGPTITTIQNNYSYIQPGFPNYGISPGTLFIVKGTSLAAPNSPAVLQDSSKGLPTLLNGSTVKVTVNGTTVTPAFYYALDVQLALVLPAGTPAGSGTLTVTYNGTASNAAPIVVTQFAPGLDAYYGTGAGLAVATDPLTGALYNYTNSVKPGATIVLWGTGFGAITADSDTTFGTPHSVPTLPTIYFGSIGVTPGYAGGSGYPGLNQINVTVPAGVATGCAISVIAVTNGAASNSLSLPIMPNGGTCTDSTFGVSGSQLQSLSNQATVATGVVGILHSTGTSTGTTDAAIGSFSKTTGSGFNSNNSGITSIGSCVVTQTVAVTGTTATPTTTPLSAGTITLTGPAGTTTLAGNSFVAGIYTAALTSGFVPANGGTFTFNATAGTDVGAFSATLNFPAPLNWTNSANSAVSTRASGQTVNWTGGVAGSYVQITGSSVAIAGSQTLTGAYTCSASATAGTFTVPPAVLLQLPAGTGSTTLDNYANFSQFTAKGLDFGFVYGGSQQSVNTTFN